jgi:hypothetical protein
MDIQAEIESLTRFVNPTLLTQRLNAAKAVVGQEEVHLIPSIILGNDGLILNRVFLITNDFLVDVRISGALEFDIIDKTSIVNMHFSIWEHESKETLYQVASVKLAHRASTLRTQLDYVGMERNAWMNELLSALPLRLLLEQRHS